MVFADYDKNKNFIQDAERHRRTPRLAAISGKAIRLLAAGFFGAVVDSMRDAGRNLATLQLQYYQISEQKIKAI